MAGQEIIQKAAMTIEMKPTTFSSGSVGYRGQGKVVDNGASYQVQVIATKIGSKPNR